MKRVVKNISNKANLLFLALTVLAISAGWAQESATDSHPDLIGAGDLLSITVYDAPEMTQQVRVESDGTVGLTLLGPTRLAGLSAQQASLSIAQGLKEKNYHLNPQVTVLVTESVNRTITVTGEVNHPGNYPISTRRTLLDAISLAGGLTSFADTHVTIQHRNGSEDQVTVQIKPDEAASVLTGNVAVYPGDLVVIPKAGAIYVLGEVGRPGGIIMQDNGRFTLLQVIAQAGGVNYSASLNKAILLHKTDTGYTSSKVEVGKILKGRIADFNLQRNDILYIPGSTIKHLGGVTTSLAEAAAGAALYHAMP